MAEANSGTYDNEWTVLDLKLFTPGTATLKPGLLWVGDQLPGAVISGDAEQAKAAYDNAVPVIDRMADKGIIHKNKAARHKSRLSAQVKALAA